MLVLQGGAGVASVVFDGWSSVLRIVVSSSAVYLIVVTALRIAGQRALAKMSGYDLIVTVALGSLVASIALSSDLSIVDGGAAVAAFLVLQQTTSWLQARFRSVHHFVRQRPQVVAWDGQFLPDRLRDANLTEDEIRAAVRRAGMLSMAQVQCVVLENDGEWSVIGRSEAPDLSALDGLEIPYLLPPGADPTRWRDTAGESAGEAPRESSPSAGVV